MKTLEEMKDLVDSIDIEGLHKAIQESFTAAGAPQNTKRQVANIFNHAMGMKDNKYESSREVLSKACSQMFAIWKEFTKGQSV